MSQDLGLEDLESVEDVEDVEEEVSEIIAEHQFIPPSVTLPISFKSSTYCTEIPSAILHDPTKEVILGVDEAGRGPVLGPMVYGIAYCLKTFEPILKKYGFDDSKILTEQKRFELTREICEEGSELNQNIGWSTTTLTSRDISSDMLSYQVNLNSQAHDATIELIKSTLSKGVNLKEVYVDTVGPPASYQKKLQENFPLIKITVTKKADSLFKIVSAASVVAKVTRDFNLSLCKKDKNDKLGSGYPSDPNTKKWLVQNMNPLFGWGKLVRYSWSTATNCLENNNAIKVVFATDIQEKFDTSSHDVVAMFNNRDDRSLEKSELSTLWWGSYDVKLN